MMRLVALMCVVALAAPASAGADAVTYQARPTHDGNAGAGLDLPLRRAWTARIAGVPSYPVTGSGRVFVTVTVRGFINPPRTVLLALSARDGRRVWQADLGRVESASPAYDDGRVFVTRGPTPAQGGVTAFSARTGVELWRSAVGSSTGNPPVAVDGVVYAILGGIWIAAFAQSDGTWLWSHYLDNGSHGSPAITAHAVLAALPCGDTRKLRRGDGALVWQTQRSCDDRPGGSTAVVARGHVYTRENEPSPGESRRTGDGTRVARWRSDYPPAFSGRLGLFPWPPAGASSSRTDIGSPRARFPPAGSPGASKATDTWTRRR
jgi:outer membrane protein assembly factor BamB